MRRSAIAVGGVGLIAAAAAGAVLAARSRARRIRGFPDPVALEDLLARAHRRGGGGRASRWHPAAGPDLPARVEPWRWHTASR